MEILTKLSPAETCLIQNQNNASFKQLLRLTMADLVLKRVIQVDVDSSNDTDTQYVSVDQRFFSYTAKPHENIFLSAFKDDPEIEIRLDHYTKLVVQKAHNRRSFIFARLLQAPGFGSNVKQDLFNRLFCTISLTRKGQQLKTELRKVFSTLKKQLPELIENDKESALVVLDAIYGNVFMVDGLDHKLLEGIDEALESHLIKRKKSSDGSFGCAGYFGDYKDTSSSFDQAFDSATDSGGSGCSGASGCSGCGGGGCGGCGG